jgi:hypothetical protein
MKLTQTILKCTCGFIRKYEHDISVHVDNKCKCGKKMEEVK